MPDRPHARNNDATPPEDSANCGAAIPRHARACPECGADERTGWRETDLYDGLNLPDHAYEEAGRSAKRSHTGDVKINGVAWYWWAVGVVLVILLVSGIIVLRW
jgi:hypothetical protein